MRGHDRRAGVAGAEERVGPAVLDRVGRHADRGAGLPAQRLRRALGHLDAIGGVDDLDVDAAEQAGDRVPGQLRFDRGRVSDEQQPDLEVPRRDQRPIDDDGRPGVAAHGVDRNTHDSDQLPAPGVQPEAGNYSSTALTCRPL